MIASILLKTINFGQLYFKLEKKYEKIFCIQKRIFEREEEKYFLSTQIYLW